MKGDYHLCLFSKTQIGGPLEPSGEHAHVSLSIGKRQKSANPSVLFISSIVTKGKHHPSGTNAV
jgi:hypothetical protein